LATDVRILEGQRLGDRYDLLQVVGEGGMATVYKARDGVLGRLVAVKVLHPQFAQNHEFLLRFLREAQSAASLIHPNIVTVYDTGRQDETHYITMEYIEGRQVKELIRERGPLPIDMSLDIARQVAEALAYAHHREIVHRDIKPHNIMLSEDGRVRVTDFGIAKAASQSGLTQDGAVLGTVQYISPEQARGELAVPQSDIYALGICLFEMITGLQPFRGDNPVEVALKHVKEELPPLTRHGEPVNGALARVVGKATSKDRSGRYASAEELAQDLSELLASSKRPASEEEEKTSVLRAVRMPKRAVKTKPAPPPAEEEPRQRRRGSRVVAWSILAVLLVVVGLVGFTALMVNVVPRVVERAVETPPVVAAKPEKLVPVAAKDFDPEGNDGSENPNDTGAAYDGDSTTAWHTDTYNTNEFGNLKQGVGIYFDLGRRCDVQTVRVASLERGWDLSIMGSDRVPETAKEWTRLASKSGMPNRYSFSLKGAKHRYILLWITRLAPNPEGDRSRVDISEVLFYGKRL